MLFYVLCTCLPCFYSTYRADKESFLANLSRDNVQLLINQIFQLPTLKVDNEVVIKLPPATTRLPRAKPAPKEKALSKWEKYAKEKGITKRKKSKATWDEELQVCSYYFMWINNKPIIILYIFPSEMGSKIWFQESSC